MTIPTTLLTGLYAYDVMALLTAWVPVLAARRRRWPTTPRDLDADRPLPHLVVVIACRNAADSFPGLVACLREQTYPRDHYRILILADNCQDDSADVARSLDVDVYERQHSAVQTKGAAVNELLERRLKHEPFDAITFLDADSRVDESYLAEVAAGVQRGQKVTQAMLLSNNSEETWATRIGRFAQTIDQVQQRGRAVLGMPAFIQGSGLTLRRESLDQLGWHLVTGARLGDDAELNLRCYLERLFITYAEDQHVSNDLPTDSRSVRLQRHRWSVSVLELFSYVGPMVGKVLRGDWRAAEGLFSILLAPPFSVFFILWGLWSVVASLSVVRYPFMSFWAALAVVLWVAHGLFYIVVLGSDGQRLRWKDAKGLGIFVSMRLVSSLQAIGTIVHLTSGEGWIPNPHRRTKKAAYSKRPTQALLLFCLLCASMPPVTLNAARSVVERRGGTVAVVKYSDGAWELQVDGKPYFIKGVVFNPIKIGEDPGAATQREWMSYDDNHNGKNDIAYDTWRYDDPKKKPVGDFQLLKEMGANTIRLYHPPSNNRILGTINQTNPSIQLYYDHAPNKALLRELYNSYGVRSVIGNFAGSWTIGSGAAWEEGTDYTNPRHRENIKRSIKAMVLDHKDEPYVLLWMIGNENNTADFSHCNAKTQPEAWASLVGELVEMIHQLDPDHPVAVSDGDTVSTVKYYAKAAPNIDILAFNSYRGAFGFSTLWKQVKEQLDRPILIGEFGAFAYITPKGEDENYQARYIQGCWRDIARQSAAAGSPNESRAANSLGGMVFHWTDQWYMDGDPFVHNPGPRPHWNSPDHLYHEEWFGLMAMDAGGHQESLMRRPRKAYEILKEAWKKDGRVL